METENIHDDFNDLFERLVKTEDLKLPFAVKTDIINDFKNKCEIYFNTLNDYIEDNDNELSRRLSAKLDR
ncbi:hypothetical protein NCI98_004754, partial [Salmonella enterica]|nr:hypothetical protein [Salmonella enterica]